MSAKASLIEHLIARHGEKRSSTEGKDLSTLDLYHFMLHDRIQVGWSVHPATRVHKIYDR